MKRNRILQACPVLLSLLLGCSPASVDRAAEQERIEAYRLAATLGMIPELVADANTSVSARYEPVTVTLGEGDYKFTCVAHWAMSKDDKPLGWVVETTGQGFSGKIELLIGVDLPVRKITGLRVLSQYETPGMGNQIQDVGTSENPGFLMQFDKGLKADAPVDVTTGKPAPGSNTIEAVSGATISSRAVCKLVNDALSPDVRQALAKALKDGPQLRSKTNG